MEDYYCVVTFHSTYHAIQFEKFFNELDYSVKLMPVPRQISSSCGTAATFQCDRWDQIMKMSKDQGIEIDDFHKVYTASKKNWFKKLIDNK